MVKQILFNTPMVQALLEHRKTTTRRLIKPQPSGQLRPLSDLSCYPGCFSCDGEARVYRPPYSPGDILWVRETWTQTPDGTYWYKADNLCSGCLEDGTCLPKGVPIHKTCKLCGYEAGYENIKWHPSIHMNKEAARIFLEVKSVRAERLTRISEKDAINEGVFLHSPNFMPTYHYDRSLCQLPGDGWKNARDCFLWGVWDRTLRKKERDLFGWKQDPWVWVITFTPCERPDRF